MGNLHIGEVYPFEGVSVIERKLGLVLVLTIIVKDEVVLYDGQTKSTQISDVSETGYSFIATEVYNHGQVANGESVALWLKGPSNDFEAITLHLAIKEAIASAEVEAVVEAPVED